MRRLKTLRARFALWTAGLLLLVLSAFGVYIYGSMARGLSTAVDNSLTLVASQVIAGLEFENDRLVSSDNFANEPENVELRARGYTVRVLTPQGQALYEFGSYLDLPISQARIASSPFFATLPDASGNAAVRVYVAPLEGSSQRVAVVQVAQSLESVHNVLGRLMMTLLVSVPLLVAIAGCGGYILAMRALAPIDQITRTARRISARDLSARLNLPPVDDEVGRLAETLDSMLARLDESFQRERQFTADASHELRTPLAAMQAILGVMRERRRTAAEYEQALADLAEETSRLRALTENLLLLARTQTHNLGACEAIDLSTLLGDVVDSVQPLADAKALTLARDIPAGLSLTGDPDAVIRLFVNLLDNAIKYTEHGGVTLSAHQNQDARLAVTIVDTGMGIPAEHLPHIFDRFYRVDESRTSRGAGLGLAIAAEIARVHGGRIEVSSAAGRGTQFTVFLPRNGGYNIARK